MKIRHEVDYRKLRKQAYPAVGDQLDAVMKLAAALKEQGIPLPEETERWISRCQEVKTKYQKG